MPDDTKRRILISGTGIAGPVTAYWLAHHGWEVTMIERARSLRLDGQNIDLTDAARDVVDRMGLMEAIRSRHTGERGMQFVEPDGSVAAEFPVDKEGSMTREIEILRGDLVELLVEGLPREVELRFDASIESIEAIGKAGDGDAEPVRVRFNDSREEEYDLLVVADGMNSHTRRMVFPDRDGEDYLGCWASYFTIPRLASDTDWWRWYTSSNGIVAFLRPDNQGTMRASVNFLSEDNDPPRMSLEDKRRRLQDRLRGSGWECDRIADALDDVDDLYLGPLCQIKLQRWSRGRCVLVGDAGYCPTPYTGMGTTLAVIGGYVLAGELSTADNIPAGLQSYEERLGGFVRDSQKLPPGVPDIAYARSRLKTELINRSAGLVASTPAQVLLSTLKNLTGKQDQNRFDLPNYAVSSSASTDSGV